MEFYIARFMLAVAEAGFFPGIIVYFTHWFPMRDRGRAMSGLVVAIRSVSRLALLYRRCCSMSAGSAWRVAVAVHRRRITGGGVGCGHSLRLD
jgi:MFS family permease